MSLVVLDAPSNLGLAPPAPGAAPGCNEAPRALRAAGLLELLRADDGGSVNAPAYRAHRDDTGVRSGTRIAAYSSLLADAVLAVLQQGNWPLVLGGDCSIMLGNLLALRRRGRAGVIFVDGHLDFRHPEGAGVVGAAAGEDLALATGRGHPVLSDLEGLGPLVDEADVVALGNNEWDEESEPALTTAMAIFDASRIHSRGGTAIATEALDHLRCRDVRQVWVHLDADVLDAEVMPAVDSPNPGGLSWRELSELLSPIVADPLVVGMELTVFDPKLDPEGRLAVQWVRLLDTVLNGRRLEADARAEQPREASGCGTD